MGTFHVELTVKNLYEPGRQRTVRVLVDTGATYTTLPRDVLDALDCQPIGTRRVLLANLLSYRPERGSGLTGRGHVGRAGTGSRPGRKKTGASAKLSHQHPMTLSAVLGAAGWFGNRRCGGTPTFFIGRADPSSSSVKVLRMVRGAQAYANFQQVLDSVLATQKSSSDSPKQDVPSLP